MLDASTPVVVLGCFRHGGLALVRSLGRLGVPVYAMHKERMTPAVFSRYCRQHLLLDLHAAAPEKSLQFLEDVSRQIGRRAILIATTDIGAMFVADNAERLAERFMFPDQDSNLVRSLCSKKEMYYLAKKWNVPTPETVFPRSRTDVEEYLATARFPVLLKPISSGPSAMPMQLIHSKDELVERYNSIEDPSTANVMMQEHVPGSDEMTWVFNGYFDRNGECKVAFTGRKLRNYPPYFGQATLGVCTHNEHVLKATIEFMKALGYRGGLDLGYRYDARDGRYKVFDINPRIGAMFRLFVDANGTDVARALYRDMTGQEVLPATIVEGRKWLVEDCDWISSVRYYRDGMLTFRGWRESFRGVKEMSYLAKDDLRPAACAAFLVVRDRIDGLRSRRLAKRVRTRQLAA